MTPRGRSGSGLSVVYGLQWRQLPRLGRLIRLRRGRSPTWSRLPSSDGQTGTASITYTVAAAPSAQIGSPAAGQTFAVGQHVATSSCSEGGQRPGPVLELHGLQRGASSAVGRARHLQDGGTFTYMVTATTAPTGRPAPQASPTRSPRRPRHRSGRRRPGRRSRSASGSGRAFVRAGVTAPRA